MANPSTLSRAGSSTSAYARHLQRADAYVRFYGGKAPPPSPFRTERDILEQNHKFIRDDKEELIRSDSVSEDKQLAKKYYDSLYREFALVDLSQSKYQKVAMRWRTKAEVLAGTGQYTCGALTCRHHNDVAKSKAKGHRGLHTLELNFAYEEAGQKKNALVKICLCRKCERLLQRSKLGREERAEQRQHKGRRVDGLLARSRSPLGEGVDHPVADRLGITVREPSTN